MTKKERADRILAVLAEAFVPEPGGGELHVRVHARSRNSLFIVGRLDGPPDLQFHFHFDLTAPDIVREIHDALLTAAGQDVIPF